MTEKSERGDYPESCCELLLESRTLDEHYLRWKVAARLAVLHEVKQKLFTAFRRRMRKLWKLGMRKQKKNMNSFGVILDAFSGISVWPRWENKNHKVINRSRFCRSHQNWSGLDLHVARWPVVDGKSRRALISKLFLDHLGLIALRFRKFFWICILSFMCMCC